MKLLVDENLSLRVAEQLGRVGHDVVHVTNVDLAGAADPDVLAWAVGHDRIIVTADTDFGALLAIRGDDAPSVVLLRSSDHLSPSEQARLLIMALDHVENELARGGVASVSPSRIRLRQLPIERW